MNSTSSSTARVNNGADDYYMPTTGGSTTNGNGGGLPSLDEEEEEVEEQDPRNATSKNKSNKSKTESASAANKSNRPNEPASIKLSLSQRVDRFMSYWLRKTVLRPQFYLRRQLFLGFGSTATLAVLFFVGIGILSAALSGKTVMDEARLVQEDLARYALGTSARYVSETITKKINNYETSSALLREATMDRMAGYKTAEFVNLSTTDVHVPFLDSLTGQAKFPLQTPDLIRLDWNLSSNLRTAKDAQLHLQGRQDWYNLGDNNFHAVSTSHAAYFMQGSCHPQSVNCTPAHNDINTGGVLRPTSTNVFLYQKSADMVYLLKSLYEAMPDAKAVGVYFANSGAGSYVKFPAQIRNATGNFTSVGCQWMVDSINPATGQPIGTPDEVANCHNISTTSTTTTFPAREYNALERPWCVRQATAQDGTPVSTGPYLDSSSTIPHWVLTFGHGVFDRITHEFVACTLVDVTLASLGSIMNKVQMGETSSVALLRWTPQQGINNNNLGDRAGMVVACGNCNIDPLDQSERLHVTDPRLGLGVDAALLKEMNDLVDDTTHQPWDPEEIKLLYNQTLFHNEGRLIMIYPIPFVPSTYDPNYSPEFMIVITISEEEIFGDSDDMDEQIRSDVQYVIRDTCLIGLGGLVVIFAFLTWMSAALSKPLLWMQEMTAEVITTGGDDLAGGVQKVNIATSSGDGADLGGSSTAGGRWRCSPPTEVTVLLSEFHAMMDGFSGKGAADVADARTNEVENKFQWREDYQILYPYDFRSNRKGTTETDDESEDGRNMQFAPDTVSIATQATFLSALTESSIVQALKKPYLDLTESLSKSASSIANASYTAGVETLPTWAAKVLLKATEEENEVPDYLVSPPKVNRGPNVLKMDSNTDDAKKPIDVKASSRIFWYVQLTVGIPIFLVAVAIVYLGEVWILSNLQVWLADVRESSYRLEKDAIVTATRARADFGTEVISRFMRDLFLYTRAAGWLLFGAVQRSDAFVSYRTGGEECKSFEKGSCPYQQTNPIVCDCAWDDPSAKEGQCLNFEGMATGSRYLQTSSFEGQRTDVSANGDRDSTTYPNNSFTPEETSWWAEPKEMPGSDQPIVSGFNTTYARVRVLSAMSALWSPVYNYDPGRGEVRHLGSYIGLEADGMMIGGAGGCSDGHLAYPHFQSSESNRASEVAPHLCPLGKYGYDCRCRGWYASTKGKETYISSPYIFSDGAQVGLSAAATLRDPVTAELVGQALLDFLPSAMMVALGPDRTLIGPGDLGFPIVITPEEDIFGANTVYGPGYSLSDGPKPIGDIILPEDSNATANRRGFEAVIASMEEGKEGNATFVRLRNETSENVFLSYAPVVVRILRPLDHRDFGASCNVSSKLVYAIGMGVVEGDLYLRFQAVESTVIQQLGIARGVSIMALLLMAIGFSILTYYISLNITRPIIGLTKIVKSIKDKSLGEELPLVEGSREVQFVHESFQRLMQVVKFANTAFFAGDRTQSYVAMEDALSLFIKLGNQKSIGVAYNNLGSMVLQEQMESHGTDRLFNNSLFGVCISEIYYTGINYFNEAIRHGTFEFEIARDTPDFAAYAKQLSNRHFNRGMFLVVVRHHPLCPSWIAEDGVSDLLKAKALDLEVLQFLHSNNLFQTHEVQEYESLLRRSRGILSLVRNYSFEDPWGIETLIEQAETMLNEASVDVNNSRLFFDMSRTGRQQQIDDLKIQRAFCQKDYTTAGKIAMRMLVEDEFIIDTVIVNASTAINRYFAEEGIRIPTINATQYLHRETRKAQVNVLREAKNVFFCLDYSGSMAGERMKRANKNLLWVYGELCSDKDWVGFIRFNHFIDEKLWFPMGKKGDWGQVQEAILALATDAEGGTRLYAALNRCVTQILRAENKNDTWIIALTDGESSWDHPAKSVVERLRKINKQRTQKIHVIIIGFEVPSSVVKSVEAITSITDKSLYIDARGGLEEMDKAFEHVVSVIGGSAITMETF